MTSGAARYSDAELHRVVGTQLRDGRFTIRGWEHRVFCSVVGATPSYSRIHPMYAFVACMKGSGTDFDSLLAMVNASAEQGPMLGTNSIEVYSPMVVDHTYDVRAEIVGFERKFGRRIGAFDLLRVMYELVDGDDVIVRVENEYVLPRDVADG